MRCFLSLSLSSLSDKSKSEVSLELNFPQKFNFFFFRLPSHIFQSAKIIATIRAASLARAKTPRTVVALRSGAFTARAGRTTTTKMERFLIRKFNTSAETNKRQNTSTFASGSSNGVKSSSASGSGSSSGPKWLTKHDSLLVRIDQSCPNKLSSKIACFDLDETLQKTKSGKKPYMTHENDFTFRDASVKEALNALHESGYKIVIFSNQGMVKSAVDGKKAEQIRKRLEIFAKEVRLHA